MTPPKVFKFSPEQFRLIERNGFNPRDMKAMRFLAETGRLHTLLNGSYRGKHHGHPVQNQETPVQNQGNYNKNSGGLSTLETIGLVLGGLMVAPPAINALAKATKGIPILGTALGGLNDLFKGLGLTRDDDRYNVSAQSQDQYQPRFDTNTPTGRYNNWTDYIRNIQDRTGSLEGVKEKSFDIFGELGGDVQNNYKAATSTKDQGKIVDAYRTGMEKFATQDLSGYSPDANGHVSLDSFVQKELANYQLTDNDITKKLADAQRLGGSPEKFEELKQSLLGKQQEAKDDATRLYQRLSVLGTNNPQGKGYVDLKDLTTFFSYSDGADGNCDGKLTLDGLMKAGKLAEARDGSDAANESIKSLRQMYDFLYNKKPVELAQTS